MAAGALVVGAFGGHIVWLSGRLGQRAGRTHPCDRRVDIATVHIGTALGCGLRPLHRAIRCTPGACQPSATRPGLTVHPSTWRRSRG